MSSVNIGIEKELHRKARILCAMRGITLSEFYAAAIKERIEQDIKLLEAVR